MQMVEDMKQVRNRRSLPPVKSCCDGAMVVSLQELQDMVVVRPSAIKPMILEASYSSLLAQDPQSGKARTAKSLILQPDPKVEAKSGDTWEEAEANLGMWVVLEQL